MERSNTVKFYESAYFEEYIKYKLEKKEAIYIEHKSDQFFARQAQFAKVTGSILVSSYKVPSEGTWIIVKNYLVNNYDFEDE